MKTLEATKKAEAALNDLAHQSLSMERDVALMKKVVRLMAGRICLDEQGKTTMELNEQDVKTIKEICLKCNVF